LDDPSELLDGWAQLIADLDQRVAYVFRALEVAAETDVEARRLLEQSQQQRLAGAREIVKRLAELGALTTATSRADAADVVWLATDPVLFDRLVRIRGWSVKRFGAWLGRMLTMQLVG
jgi:hypothetical protein